MPIGTFEQTLMPNTLNLLAVDAHPLRRYNFLLPPMTGQPKIGF